MKLLTITLLVINFIAIVFSALTIPFNPLLGSVLLIGNGAFAVNNLYRLLEE